MILRVYMTVLTRAPLDQFKLALIGLGKAGLVPGTDSWCVDRAGYIGCLMRGEVEMPDMGGPSLQWYADKIVAQMSSLHVQYLSMLVREMVPNGAVHACVSTVFGEMSHDDGPYRTSPGGASQ